ncbi:hypothetical protein OSB04_022833 [Centaurea solstitialis]|uniref:Uncharacterized protein n=1 Tax=Centaurea solstitialis TaxID=347529 RepID=A0AA38WCB4_9ASTR|nr:hypothetical protein OSB04_022833 [Centaurea solstitialis]
MSIWHRNPEPNRDRTGTETGPEPIWIFETFPVIRRYALRSGVIPRAIAWQCTQTITWDMCLSLLDVDDDARQPLTVTPTDVERETDWWRDSQRFFDSVTDDFQPPTKRGRSYSPLQQPPPPPVSSFSGIGASVPEVAATVPPPLEQRVAALEQAVRDLQSGQRATQAGQRAMLESMARLHETVQRALETNHRTKVKDCVVVELTMRSVRRGSEPLITFNLMSSNELRFIRELIRCILVYPISKLGERTKLFLTLTIVNEVRSKDTRPINVADDVAEGAP